MRNRNPLQSAPVATVKDTPDSSDSVPQFNTMMGRPEAMPGRDSGRLLQESCSPARLACSLHF